VSVWLVDRAAAALGARTSRRGFLARSSLVATALAVAPAEYVLRPGTAYGAICGCVGQSCTCGSACCDGYTEFCCTLHHGSNTCPPGTFAGGWWKADGSAYCAGPRYYVDCHAECSCTDGCGGGYHFCSNQCDGLDCGCALGDCNHRRAGCVTFRYGQCHTDISCAGRIACRVVTCTPAYLLDNACGSNSFTDDFTANHNAPCLEAPPVNVREYGFAAHPAGGFWMSGLDGGVFSFDGAPYHGSMGGQRLDQPVVAMAGTPSGNGYWLAALDGGIFSYGDAGFHGSLGGVDLFAPVVAIKATATGAGYWLAASDGGVFTFGDAGFHGSVGGTRLAAPVVDLAPTPSGDGYWMVASDGGVFTFGDAGFHGSMGGQALTAAVTRIVATPTGQGYYLLGQDGAVYTFGDAVYYGSYGSLQPDPALPANGIDAFYGMILTIAGSQVTGYTLYAVSGTQPPPPVRRYPFGTTTQPAPGPIPPLPTTTTTVPPPTTTSSTTTSTTA